jgi:stage V sporulation protein G
MTPLFSNIRVTLCGKNMDNAPGPAAKISLKIADAFWITDLRLVEGHSGFFVSMPSRQAHGDYFDVCFPASKEVRDELLAEVLKAYNEAVKAA